MTDGPRRGRRLAGVFTPDVLAATDINRVGFWFRSNEFVQLTTHVLHNGVREPHSIGLRYDSVNHILVYYDVNGSEYLVRTPKWRAVNTLLAAALRVARAEMHPRCNLIAYSVLNPLQHSEARDAVAAMNLPSDRGCSQYILYVSGRV